MVAKLYDNPPGSNEFDGIDGYEMYTRRVLWHSFTCMHGLIIMNRDEQGNFQVDRTSESRT